MFDQDTRDELEKLIRNLVARTEEYFWNNRCELSRTGDITKYVVPETIEAINKILKPYCEKDLAEAYKKGYTARGIEELTK